MREGRERFLGRKEGRISEKEGERGGEEKVRKKLMWLEVTAEQRRGEC